ncbi:MAG: VCBS repeat-containing protein [Devosiaceae bacterium]|nr:VCBS repeat-containing protein [Devosiaceae bacterium]
MNYFAKFLLVVGLPLALISGAMSQENTLLSAANDPDAIADGINVLGEKDIAEAWLINPTTRYPHFVLGADYEPSGIRVRLKTGKILSLILDEEFVFEDRIARLADLDGDGRDEIIQVMSSQQKGASLAIFSINDGALVLKTRTPFIGRSSRWLNPAGIADFNGDGVLDIALVQMPHLVKRLELWTLKDGRLLRNADAQNYSNHKLGSPYLGLSAVADFNGDGIDDLAILRGNYSSVSLLSFAEGGVNEFANYAIDGVVRGDFELEKTEKGWRLEIGLSEGENFSLDILPDHY